MITAILLVILGLYLIFTHWFWDILFFGLALLLTVISGGVVCMITLPIMVLCVCAYWANKKK